MEYSASDVLLMKAKDRGKLIAKQITDSIGRHKTVWVLPTEVASGHSHPSDKHAEAVEMYNAKKKYMSKDKAYNHVVRHVGKYEADYARGDDAKAELDKLKTLKEGIGSKKKLSPADTKGKTTGDKPLDDKFNDFYGDKVFNNEQLAMSFVDEKSEPKNFCIASYGNDFVVTTNSRASQFSNLDSDFKVVGTFDKNGNYLMKNEAELKKMKAEEAYQAWKAKIKINKDGKGYTLPNGIKGIVSKENQDSWFRSRFDKYENMGVKKSMTQFVDNASESLDPIASFRLKHLATVQNRNTFTKNL